MNRKNTAPIPEAITQLQRQLEQFRSTGPARTKLLEPLWQAAVELARQHGGDAGDRRYWTALYDVLESYGFAVNVVNARHTKTLPGRKTDVLECQWRQKLHIFGLLNNSFRPAEEIRVLRSYLRQRENLVTAAGMAVQHMQKALTEMNIRLANGRSHVLVQLPVR